MAESSPGLNDRTILEHANRDDRVIVTFDKDFGELVFRESLAVRGLILLRFTPISPEQIAERIQSVRARGYAGGLQEEPGPSSDLEEV